MDFSDVDGEKKHTLNLTDIETAETVYRMRGISVTVQSMWIWAKRLAVGC